MSQGVRSVTREAILKAAIEVTAREGLEGASLGAIAREAGTSKPLVLYHFRTRKQLLREMAGRILERIQQVLRECIQAGEKDSRWGPIRAVFAKENRPFYAALHGVKSLGSRDAEVGSQLRCTFDHLAQTTAGLLGSDPTRTLPRAHALVIGIQGYIDLWLYSGDPNPEPYLRGAALLTSAMLVAPDERAPRDLFPLAPPPGSEAPEPPDLGAEVPAAPAQPLELPARSIERGPEPPRSS